MLRAAAIAICVSLNLLLWGTFVLLGGVVKLVTRGRLRRRVVLVLAWFGDVWVATNTHIFALFLNTRWDVRGLEGVRRDGHYLVISNHLSWIDIFALQRAFDRKAPLLRFFIKQQLIWSPILGQACWALEFPFMRRYSAEYLQRHPEKRGRDLEETRRACERYRDIPVTILNFVEGTRLTRETHAQQSSPYEYLLRPRIGGIGFVIASLPGALHAMYDVTLVYPKRDAKLIDFITDRLPWIVVEGRRIEIPPEFHRSTITEPGPDRERFKEWVERLWREKDQRIGEILAEKNGAR